MFPSSDAVCAQHSRRNHGQAPSRVSLLGAISGSGNLILGSTSTVASNSFQTIRLNAQSSYTGSTTLNPADNDANLIVKLGIANALPTTTVLSVNGAAGGGTGRDTQLDLNGFNQTLGGLQNTVASLRNQQVINTSATAATLTINNSTNHNFCGNINGANLSLIKNGSGRQALSGTNTYTGSNGTFSLSGGMLDLATNPALLAVGRSDTAANNTTVTYQQTGGTATAGTLTIGGAAAGSSAVVAGFSITGGSFAADNFPLLAAGDANTATMTIGGTAEITLPAFPTARGLDSAVTLYFDGGTLKLTGANTYSGTTTVNGGTLSLGTINSGNELSTVTLAASGALLKLTFPGTDTVARLFIGTDQKPAGQYGHSSTGATNGGLGVGAMDVFFAPGTGTLTVTGSAPLTDYTDWKASNAPTGTAGDDFDGDGVSNGVEYVLGATASAKDSGKLPSISTSGGNLAFSFIRDQASIDGITTLEIQTGENLANWTSSYPVPATAVADNPGLTVLKNIPVPGKDTVTLTLPLAGSTKFARLKVTP